MEKTKAVKKATIEDVLVAINELTAVVSKFIAQPAPVEIKTVEATVVAPTPEPVASSNLLPIPIEYLEARDTILNKRFAMEITYLTDSAGFQLSVLVPKEYSNAAKPHWDMYHEDRRSKVIENAFGTNGVREWLQLVYENFNNEMKSRITSDRALVNL